MAFRRLQQHHQSSQRKSWDSLVDELSYLLHGLDADLFAARQAHYRRNNSSNSLVNVNNDNNSSSGINSATAASPSPSRRFTMFKRVLKRMSTDGEDSAVSLDQQQQDQSDSEHVDDDIAEAAATPRRHTAFAANKRRICFVHIPKISDIVEKLRRIAELVVIGENYTASLQKKKDQRRSRDELDAARDDSTDTDNNTASDGNEGIEEDIAANQEKEKLAENDERLQLFDIFFEKGTLELIVNMLTGEYFEQGNEIKHSESTQQSTSPQSTDAILEHDTSSTTLLLPPLAVAIQAIQSLSILVQNVSRATSLYFILSNNYINTLIQFPLSDLYAAALKRQLRKQQADVNVSKLSSHPEIVELTTHFITFLKCLALRMNAETLQFYLQYHSETGMYATPASSSHFAKKNCIDSAIPLIEQKDSEDSDTIADNLHVTFPLYDRTLDFCAAHQDSFVRVTAMNICLNTLRLTTVGDGDGDGDDGTKASNGSSSNNGQGQEEPTQQQNYQTPDGVLHNALALPFRERLAIAQHACTPSRVERLIAPIFTTLADRWNSLYEQILAIDSTKIAEYERMKNDSTERSIRQDKATKAKEKVRRDRLIRSFRDKAANLQDELMILEDVFNVGLTVLNEQTIEMMMATFVYPMLLQPLVLFKQRFDQVVEYHEGYSNSQTQNFDEQDCDCTDIEAALVENAASAKTALFTIGAIFQYLENLPLLRLLYIAVFHPLSPDSSTMPSVRSNLEVSETNRSGQTVMRLDRKDHVKDDRASYPFGTIAGNRQLEKTKPPCLKALEGAEACVFVLAPALAEILEFQGGCDSLLSRTRRNTYRNAFLCCLNLPDEMIELRDVACCAISSALLAFKPTFASKILFGTDLPDVDDEIPPDELTGDSVAAYEVDDRDMGRSGVREDRLKAGLDSVAPCKDNLLDEFMKALCDNILSQSKDLEGVRRFEYNESAANTLLIVLQTNVKALPMVSHVVASRHKQARRFVTNTIRHMTETYDTVSIWEDSASLQSIYGAPVEKLLGKGGDGRTEELLGSLVNYIAYDEPVLTRQKSIHADSTILLEKGNDDAFIGFAAVCREVSMSSMTDCIGRTLAVSSAGDSESQLVDSARSSLLSFVKADTLSGLLDTAVDRDQYLSNAETLSRAVFCCDGRRMYLTEHHLPKDIAHQAYFSLSTAIKKLLFPNNKTDTESIKVPKYGITIEINSANALPCVCETPESASHLFTSSRCTVVAEGVTWQSLFLCIHDGVLIFAQPDADAKTGRVITACLLERVSVEHDAKPDTNSPARRLIINHKWVDLHPPTLFMFNSMPFEETININDVDSGKNNDSKSLVKAKEYTSNLDIWFEDQRTVDRAYKMIIKGAFQAKSKRGLQALICLG